MNEQIIISYIERKKYEYKVVNGQLMLERSPISGEKKRNHFYIDLWTWLRKDHKQGAKWNWSQFLEMHGDLYDAQFAISNDSSAMVVTKSVKEVKTPAFTDVRDFNYNLVNNEPKYIEYLHNRWVSDKAISYFKLGIKQGAITIPIVNKEDTVVNIRYRCNPLVKRPEDMPKYRAEPGCKSCLFNERVLNQRPSSMFVTEGEFDAMCLWSLGITNVVSVTGWAHNFDTERATALEWVQQIYLCFDNDTAGREGAYKVAEMLGIWRCKLVKLPSLWDGKTDITDYFTKHKKTKEDFMQLVEIASSPLVDDNSVKHISEYNDILRESLLKWTYNGVSTGYDWLDKIMGWYREGRLIILAGLTSTGKTTSAINLALQLACNKVKTFFVSMEMPPLDICKRFLWVLARISGSALDNVTPENEALLHDIDAGLSVIKWGSGGYEVELYISEHTGEISLKRTLESCRIAVEMHGAKVLVIDHLHYFWHSTGNRSNEIANIVRQIKNLAMELKVPIILLAHLNRAGRAIQRRGLYIPSLVDLKESGAIEQDADQVLFMCRDSETISVIDKRKTVWKLAKNRDWATWHVSLDFDLDTGVIAEVIWADYLSEGEVPKEQKKKKEYVKIDDIAF